MQMEITIQKTGTPKPKPDENKLGFGTIFTDHMFNMDYNREKGWHNPRIEPYGPLSLDPSTMVLHYGQAIFEGLKAFRTDSGEVKLFRAKDNFSRLNRSAKALCIPEMNEDFLLSSLKELLRIEKDWVPGAAGTSLYIRPTVYASDPFLGVRASHTYRYFVILSPVGAYYAAGFNPVKIWVTRNHVRAVRGGLGESKTGGNYAASLFAGEKASQMGYAQVLWLDGVERKYVEEVGSMNIFFVIDEEVITPALNGSILPGITRDSVIRLVKSWGMKMTERQITIEEVFSARHSGRLKEIFGSGTAAVISPVGEIKYGDEVFSVGDGNVGPTAEKLFKAITDIQYGREKDGFGWVDSI